MRQNARPSAARASSVSRQRARSRRCESRRASLASHARDVLGRRFGAQRLRTHVMDLEREDRQTVDHRAGRFGVVPCIGRGRHAGDSREQRLVDLLDRIVALLVVAIDRALVRRDRRIRDVGAARLILFVPQQVVVAMIGGNEAPRVAVVRSGGRGGRAGCDACVVIGDQRARREVFERIHRGSSIESIACRTASTPIAGMHRCCGHSATLRPQRRTQSMSRLNSTCWSRQGNGSIVTDR